MIWVAIIVSVVITVSATHVLCLSTAQALLFGVIVGGVCGVACARIG